MGGVEPGSRLLDAAIAVENFVQRALVEVVGRFGRRRVAVLSFLGHGSPDRVHVRARVVLGRAGLPEQPAAGDRRPPAGGYGVSAAGDRSAGGSEDGAAREPGAAAVAEVMRRSPWRTLATSLGRFLTVELPGAVVTVRSPAGPCSVVADREGYVDAVVDGGGLSPGWHDLPVTAEWRGRTTEAVVRVLVIDPEARLAVVSDVDDTVIETGLTRGLAFLRITLLTEVADREPLRGAAPLYRALTAGPDGSSAAVFYLSTSPWNLHDLLLQFIGLREFPAGPLLLTDWGPGRGSLFRIPAEEHKLTLIRQVLADHPNLRLMLVGDTGQVDPEIYAAVAAEAPDRLVAIYVRRTPGISPERDAEVSRIVAAVSAVGVPMLAVDDSVQIAEHAERIGLLDPSAVQAVRTASTA